MEKKHILDEIRRTAAARGGAPLGRLQFFNETGIKEHDWRGVHWSRWSDAVSEAGLSPNQKTEAYDEKFLLDALAGLIRDIKRFPTGSDIRLRTRKGDGFPYDNTFRRIGSKAEISAKLIAHLNGRPGFENVVAVCKPLAETLIPQSSTDYKGSKFKEGFVYLLRSGRRYKIGATNDLATRSKAIAVQMPDPTETVHVTLVSMPPHRAELRTSGELPKLCSREYLRFGRPVRRASWHRRPKWVPGADPLSWAI
jgi:hypothetical protein